MQYTAFPVPTFASDTVLQQALRKWQLSFSVSLYLLGPEFAPAAGAQSCF